MAKPRAHRREILPLKRVQLKLVAVLCLPLVLACLTIGFFNVYIFLTSIRSYKPFSSEFAQQYIPSSIYVVVFTLLVVIPLVALVVIWVSYHIVGPMRRLEGRLKAVSEGQIGEGFHFRQGDDLLSVAEGMVRMEESLNERLSSCRRALVEAEESVQRNDSAATAQALADLRARLYAFQLVEDAEPPQEQQESSDK